ncbi:MAG: putative DNA-binding domain-containing protein [Betaproteobacteria bacterium]|nr:putative DNA-binding domain-containing protein [Betaproteobacteria bacterium]
MTTSLEAFQDRFARALVALDPSEDCAPELAGVVAQPGFSVYRNTVMKGCIDALQANYPGVMRLVGEEWFRAAAAIFVRTDPPSHPMLADYGAGLADFLAAFEPAAELPYLPAVARLDRFWSEAHIARDAEPLDPRALTRLAPGQLARTVLSPHPSARWAWFPSLPITTIWRRNRDAHGAEDGDDIDWRGEGVLLVRPRDAVENIDLDAAGCAFLDACAAGRTLADAALAALEVNPETKLARLTTRLLAAGAIAGLRTLNDHPEENT